VQCSSQRATAGSRGDAEDAENGLRRRARCAAATKSCRDRRWRADRAAAGISTPRAVLRASACLRDFRVKCSCRADGQGRALYRDDCDSSTLRSARNDSAPLFIFQQSPPVRARRVEFHCATGVPAP
jgi:hypothetical protein